MQTVYKRRLGQFASAIENYEENACSHHIKCIIKRDTRLSGNIAGSTFILWRYSYWFGILYPIIKGTVREENGQIKARVKSSINCVGWLFYLAIFLLIFIGVFTIETHSLLGLTLSSAAFFLCFSLAFYVISIRAKKEIRKEINELLSTINQQ